MAATTAAGKEIRLSGSSIAGVAACIPSQRIGNDYFVEKFGEAAVRDVVKMIGVQERRWSAPNVSTGDLCLLAGKRLLAGLDWDPASVDAIIFVSQTPNYRLPATACELQSGLGLPTHCIAFDINLGCSGYPYALWLASSMISSGSVRRVLLAVGDVSSKMADPDDRATGLLFGDTGTVTAVQADDGAEPAHFILGTDGAGAANLIVPEGGFKTYPAAMDARMNGKNPCRLYMDGGEIFNFTLRSVPPLVQRTVEFAGHDRDSYDAFLFHQANLFMLKHLIKKSGLAADKAPINIDRYGNTSSASIPLLMLTEMREALLTDRRRLAMFGFGVGYSWASAAMAVGPLKCAELIEA
ncbi:ketoacyl-ACP synthase III [Bordetella sp. LUAb4]|uniref:ketoacyl-ACP synthase III n=1 Tax=Bordetella sp. LUAb4 TaxID=2843195 RepID=UPI001E57FFBA|nr:ketoacyl-ACP synthase III [Bordetella sp. LUAb4]